MVWKYNNPAAGAAAPAPQAGNPANPVAPPMAPAAPAAPQAPAAMLPPMPQAAPTQMPQAAPQPVYAPPQQAAPAPAPQPVYAPPPQPQAAPVAPPAPAQQPVYAPPPQPTPAEQPRRRGRRAAAAAAPAPGAPAGAFDPTAQQTGYQVPPQVPGYQPQPTPAQIAPVAAVPVANTPAVASAQGLGVQVFGFLKALIPAVPDQKSAIQAATEIADIPAGEPNLFPTVYVTGGATGGMLDLDPMNVEGSDSYIPTGRKPLHGVVLGYRYVLIAWPHAYTEGGPKSRPLWRATIGAGDPQNAALLVEASGRYQFRQRPPQGVTQDPVWDNLGHPQIALEILLFEAQIGLFVARTCQTYESTIESGRALINALPGGVLQPCSLQLDVKTEDRKSKNRTWKEHFFVAMPLALSQYKQHLEQAFMAFYQANAENPDLNNAVNEWGGTSLTPEQIQVLAAMTAA